MKPIILTISAVIIITGAAAQQINAGGGVGYFNKKVTAQMKTQVITNNSIAAMLSVSFSQRVPMQNSLTVGYAIGNTWQVVPNAGVAYYQYAGTDRHKNYFRPAYGVQVQRVLQEAAVYVSLDSRFIGAGILVRLKK